MGRVRFHGSQEQDRRDHIKDIQRLVVEGITTTAHHQIPKFIIIPFEVVYFQQVLLL